MFLIGMFIRGASQMSYQQIVIRRALEGEKVSRFMVSEPVTVPPETSLSDLVEDYIYEYHYKMYPVVENEKLAGCVELKQVKEIPKEERQGKKVQDIMKSCSPDNTVRPDEDAVKALSIMKQKNRSRLMVVDNDKLVGVVALKDMLEFLNIKVDLDSK